MNTPLSEENLHEEFGSGLIETLDDGQGVDGGIADEDGEIADEDLDDEVASGKSGANASSECFAAKDDQYYDFEGSIRT